MNKLLLLFTFTFFISCADIQYDAEKRLVFQTQIVDGENLPLKNSFVNITVSNQNASDEISNGKTDTNGRITLIFPSPEDQFNIGLKIYNQDNSYLTKEIALINNTNFTDFKFTLDKVNLLKREETVALNLTYNQTSGNILNNVGIIGIYHTNLEFYNSPNQDYYTIPTQFLIRKNQSFQLKYTVTSFQNGEEIINTIDLNIGTEAIDYTLNY